MSIARSLISLIWLVAAACGPSGRDKPAVEQDAAPPLTEVAAAPPPPAPGLAPSPPPVRCDSPAAPIATRIEVRAEIQATNAGYPANARYYCFAVPDGASLVTLDLTGLSADLDLYVGHGSIDTVQGIDLTAGETYEWKSNAFGTVDESVTLVQPRPGVYYVEIVSYEGAHSAFVFSVR